MRNHFWAAVFLFAAAGVSLRAQTLTTLHSFDGADGVSPNTGVIQGTDGNLYGSTASGGANGNGGTLFHITPAGVLTTFYSFCAQSGCTDGNSPDGLVQAANGDFYGATSAGGNQNCGNTAGCGTIFKITSAGALTTLYSFCSQGGSACTDGYAPYAPLLKASNGNFYSTTASGGAANCYDGCGTIFKITPAGVLTTLHTFCAETGCLDGYDSEGLIQATNAQLYGTTFGGCTANGCGGTFFRMTLDGVLTTLYHFCSQPKCTDGINPSMLVQATDGDFYGTTYTGADSTYSGTIFQITPGGTLTTLYMFCAQSGCPDGQYLLSSLVEATNGDLYGTTLQGGTNCPPYGCGTVFSFSVGLGPFVETLTASGKVGAPVQILGTNLTDVESVTFNGTPASFTIVSSSEITATVPAGATTGTIQVATPDGTLSSNVPFRVD